MAKQYTVIVTSTEAQDLRTHKVAQHSGDKGKALRIKAKAGETYQLVELQPGQAQSYAPQQVKVKRVGKDLVITFEGGSRPDIVIEGYYDVMPKDHKGLIGLAEDGNFYEYIPEDPHPLGMVQLLPEGGKDVAMALGAGEIIAPAEAAIAAFPLLGALGLLGGAAAAAYVINKKDPVTNNGISGKLSNQSDNIDGGDDNDNRTRDNTPTLTGTVPVGSTAVVTVNGVDYPATVNPDGTWTASIDKTNLPDGTYYPVLKVTQNGVTTPHNITPFTIDTTPPSIAITADKAALANGETSTITFTLSEAVADFNQGDVQVTGGTLSNFQRDPSNPLKYTATFTPTAGSTPGTATINVANDKFSDAVANFNTDGAEANNTVTLTTNATVTGALQPVGPNDSGPLGDNITNDNTPALKGKVPAGSTATVTLNGKTYPATVDAQGNWTAQIPDTDKLPDGTYTPQLIVTPPGSTTPNAPVPITPFTIDTVPPSIVVTAPTSSLVAGQTTPITFTLSEPVADFDQNDVAVTGGTLSNFQQSATDPKVYTATFTPASTGTSATISVASSKFSDAAANYNTDGAETNNTVTLATNAAVSGGLAPVSDNSTGIPNDNTTNDATPELSGKAAPGSTVKIKIKDKDGNVVGEGTATVDPNGNWTYTQPDNLPDGTYSPEVIVNGGTPVPLKPFHIDTLPPTVIVSAPVSTLAAGASTTVTFTLTEAATNLTDADFVVTGGTLGALQQSATDPKVYTATFTSTNGGAGAVSIANNAFSDAAGNLNKDTYVNPASTGATYEANNTWAFNTGNPTPTPGATTGALDPASDSGVMGDNKTNDPTPTISGDVPAGSTAKIKLNGKEYPVDVKPDGSYSFTPPDGLPDGTYTPELIVTPPGATTPNAPVPVTPFTIDTKPPTIAITADKTQLLAGQTTVVTFTVSEAVSDFVAADITATGGSLGELTHVGVNSSGQDVYTAVFTPANNSTATSVISVGSGKFSDAANNFNTDGDEVNNTLMLPTNTVAGGGTGFLAPNSDSGTPGDNVTNDDTPTITGKVPPGSTASVNINGKDYPVTVNPDGSYSYTIPDGLPDGTYTPKIKVTPPGSVEAVESDGTPFTIDTTPPTVLVTSDKTSLSTGQTATITFTLSEDSSDFTLADVTATGGTLSNLQGSGKVYTATFTPSANSTATSTVKVDSLKFSDAAGNFNVDGADTGVANTNIVSMATNTTLADTTAPTIAISADRSSLATGQTTLVTFTLSEASSNFTADKVTLSSGTLTGFAQSPSNPLVYTATYTPAAGSTADSVISVASNKFSDAAGNNNADGLEANNTVSLPTNTTPGLVTGALDPKSDTGTPGDNQTLDNTPTISGTAPPGSKVDVVINGKTYSGTADDNGQYSINVPDALPDGTYTPEIRVTPPGGPTSSTDGTPFTIDTMAPTILVASDKTSLSAGQTATITFTLSEASSDFTLDDIAVTGGTLSNLTGSGTSYTATFTPTANSTTTSVIHVASDKFSDAAGNFNADGAETNNTVSMVTNTLPADTTPPTIVVARTHPGAELKAGDTETITFTLSEASTSFNIGDIDAVGGTLSNFAAVPTSGTAATGYTQYTATFTPTAGLSNGSATVGVAAGKFTDNAGNANQDDYNLSGTENANNQVAFTYNTTTPDTTAPTVALSRSGTGTLAAGGSEVINIVLSEASTDFDLTDIVVTGGTLSGFAPVTASGNATTGYTDYVVTFTPNANASGNATIGVLSGKFSDAANNLNKDTYTNPATGTDVYEANNLVSLAYNTNVPDTTAPTIAVSRSGLGVVSSTETIYFTLSEASTTFALDDIDATGGTLSNLVPVASSGTPSTGYTQYSATFTPAANSSGVAAIGVASDKFTDAAGNLNKDTYLANVSGATQEANNAVSFNYNTVTPDNTAPTVAVSRSGTGIVTSSETITFTLSEASKDFALEDISVTGGTLAGLSPVLSSGSAASGYTEYTATFTPTSGTTGVATVGVASDKFSDAAGNFNKDTFVAGVSGTTQEVNNSVSFNFNNVAPDTTAPTIAIARLGTGTLTSSETITFTLSEASKDFTLADITVNGGTLKDLAAVPTSGTAGTGYTQYVATFTPTANASGLATIGVLEGKFSDAAGNLNQDTYTNPATAPAVYEANNKVEISYNTVSPATDTTPPTVIVARAGSATLQTGNTETLTFTLSEPSLSFDQSDVTLSAGTLSNWTAVASSGSPSAGYTLYTATYTPAASSSGTATIGVQSDKFTDLAHNLNKDTYLTGQTGTTYEANNQVTVDYNTTQPDKTAPKVKVVRSGSGTLTGPETIYFNFTEATTDFALEDISVNGGTLSNLIAVTGSGNTQYTATFTPTAASTGTATIGVAAGKFSDAAANFNDDTFDPSTANYEANNQVNIDYNTNANPADTTAPTVAISRAGTGTVTSTETLVFTFSEPVTGFDASDILVTTTGAAPTAAVGTLGTVTVVPGSGNTQYTVTYTAPAGSVGSVTFGVKAGAFTDTASTPNANKDTYSDTADTVSGHMVEANNALTLAWDTDTTAPTVAVTSSTSAGTTLGINQTSTITFTLSEASADFTQSDVSVTGGTLSDWTKTSDTVYTATFTPTPNNSGTATIGVKAGTFNDLGGNINKDTFDSADTFTGKVVEGDNKVDIAYNTLGATFTVNNDTNAVAEDGNAITGNVKTNDSLVASVTSVSHGSTSGTLGQALLGTYGSLVLNADGSYTYTIDNTKPAVQALKAGQQVTEVFSYTGANTGATQSGSANLVITITGTNDAPVAVADTATAVEAGGTANGTAGTNPTGNVLTNDTDVDTGDTKTVSAISGGTVGVAKAGTYGSLTLNADGSYSYTLTQGNASVEALLPTSTPLTDTFTYTVKDSADATHTATLTVSITGANDKPTVATAIADKTGTVGTALTPIDVTSNFADVDTSANGETATYSAKLVDSAGNLVNGGNLPSWLQLDATTGIFTGTPPAGTAAGDIYIRAIRTDKGGLSASDDFKITLAAAADTTPPTVAISSNQASLSSGQTAEITFTFSEEVTGFVWDHTNPTAANNDIEVEGGTLGALTHVGVNSSGQDIYTATFTPTPNSQANGVIKIAAGKFTDTATTPNANVDTYVSGTNYEANNTVTLTVDTTVASSLTLLNDTATAVESGVTSGNTAVAGTNPSGNVTSNDTAVTSVTKIALSGGSDSTITAGSTSASNGTSVTGQYGTLVMGADGSYTYTVDNNNATVNALQVGGSLTEVFTYTATDGTSDKTANLSVTINGTNDAPTVAVALVDQTGTTGTALSYTFDSGTFADVDTADTKTYTAQLVDSNGNLVGNGDLPSWLTFTAATRTFTGSTSNAAGTYYVKVTDTDSQSATASDIFKIVISDAVTPSVKTALSINPVTGDNLLDGTDQGTTNTTISGKVTGTFAEGDTVTLVVNGHNYTATAAADGSYSVSVLTSDLTADTDTKIEGSVTGGNGGQYATAAQSYVLDADAPSAPTKTALAIDPITADNVVLSSEKDGSNNITITGKVSGKFEAGTDTVTLTINGQTYTSAAVANDGTFSVDVAYSDLAADADTTVDGTVTGTGGTTATAVQNYALVDETPPTIAVTRSGSGDMTGNETITFTLSEASTDFAFEDVTVTGDGTLDSSTWQAVSSTVYTAIFIPTANKVGTASVGVKAGTFHDAANNANKDTYEPFVSGTVMEENNLQTMNVRTDVTPPTIAIDQITSPVTGAVDVTFTLSEASSDFTAADVFVTAGAGSLSNWTAVSGTVYTATFTPTANSSGNVTIGVAAGKFSDAAGLFNKDTYTQAETHVSGEVIEDNNNKTDFTYNTDVTPPTVAITGPSGAVNGPVTITFTLSEVSTDFALSDVVVLDASNNVVSGALTNFAQSGSNPLVYTATYTPPATSTGAVTINIASDTFKDPAGNFNKDGGDVNNHLPISYDTVTPTVVVTRATDHVLGRADASAPYTTELITFTLSEASTDFTWDATAQTGSITVSGGTLSALSTTDNKVYTATFTPTPGAAGTGTIGVAAGKFHDAAGNANADTYLPGQGANTQAEGTADANQVSVAYDTQAPTQTVSFGSMTKDSALDGQNNNDWLTADASAGRLVSGFLSAPLNTGETVQIWVKKDSGDAVLLGNATVNAAGTAWEFTDTTDYVGATGATGNTAGWTYTGKVVDAAGNAGTATDQIVNGDYTEAAPVITGVTDSASTSIADNGTTANTLGSISGTGVAGNTVYVYDNTGTNLVGSAVVQAGGTWTITGLGANTAISTGSNTFAAKQVDPLGNESVLSNLWTVSAEGSYVGSTLLQNGDFSGGNTGFTTTSVGFADSSTSPTHYTTSNWYTISSTLPSGTANLSTTRSPSADITVGGGSGTVSWFSKYNATNSETVVTNNPGVYNGNPDGKMSGNVLEVNLGTAGTVWQQSVSVVAGQTYTFEFDYQTNLFGTAELGVLFDGTRINFTTGGSNYETGHFKATYTATQTKTITLGLAADNTANGQNNGDAKFDNFTFAANSIAADGSLTAGSTPPATPNPDTLAYTAGALDAEGGDDLITVASTSLQTTLTNGGFIDGGAGIDTLQLAAGTTLNLEALTGTQTVATIQEVEIFKMQGTSTLRMSANDVLSLGGANASTMTPFSFESTQQVDDTAGGVTTEATGSTNSTGKVQMVIQGTSTDTLKLDSLLTDGVVNSANFVLGNAGLAGTWDYKGTVQIGLTTYKVYDHSTTNAQVLVDVPVIVNAIDPIQITTIDDANATTTGTTGSNDTGTSATDFVTSDPTLVFKGTTPNLATGEKVKFELLDASNNPVNLAGGSNFAYVTPVSNVWTFDNTGSTLPAGNYTIAVTIVDSSGNTVSSYGALGIDTHPLTIDTTLPTIVVTRATSNTLSAGQTETITFTLSEASTDFTSADVTVTNGEIINFSGSGTTYTATYVPASGSGTGTIKVDSTKFSDLAGNFNNDGADTAAGTTNIVSVDYQALPTQTVTFSSMTKDSGLPTSTTNNHDWLTNDGSAGRLVSGTLDAALTTGQKVQVFANGTSIGFATVVDKAWEITDTTGYITGWTYTAKVVDSAGNAGPVTTQVVNTDFTEAAPVITSVIDSANTSVTLNGTTANALSTVSGTGAAGDTVYLYDNTGTNLVGTTTVASNGTWTISGLASNAGVGAGSNTFSARQVDALGNSSVLSNLFTVTTTAVNNVLPNGDLSGGNAGFTTGTVPYDATGASAFNSAFWTGDTGYSVGNQYESYDAPLATTLTASGTATATTQTSVINWSTKYATTTNTATLPNPDGAFVGNALYGGVKGTTEQEIWRDTVSVVAGKTYTFKLDYWNDSAWLNLGIGSQKFQFTTSNSTAATTTSEAGHLTVTFTALTTGPLDLKLFGKGLSTGGDGNYVFDNFAFGASAIAADGSLVEGGTPPATANADATLKYTGGALDALDGNDTITASSTTIQSQLSGGGFINGAGGVDNLILAAGCLLNLPGLTTNQTVKRIEQVEIFTMQGSTALRMSANDVLSLGGANASTMSAYSFSSTSGGTASTASTDKVQMVIHGTSSDTLVLDNLMTDGVTTNGIVGNTGLAGQWDYMGTTTANGATYKVYNQSTTGAQVLVDQAVNVIVADETSVTKTVAFSSMTKDSGISASNSDWATNDGSAGRLVSGTVSSALAADEEVQVFANGTLVGNATLNADRTAWEFTDTQGYSGNWIYTAQVVNTTTNVGGLVGVRWVVLDKWAAAPVILAVTDSAGADIVNNGSTATTLSTVSGTGAAGETIYLYDNTGTNLVGTTTVASNGTWSISGLASNAGVGAGSNTFSARQVDVVGNTSVLSNLWTVTSNSSTNLVANGDFAAGAGTGFTTTLGFLNGNPTTGQTTSLYNNADPTAYVTVTSVATPTTTPATNSYSYGSWAKDAVTTTTNFANPDGALSGRMLWGQIQSPSVQTLWSQNVSVVAGKTYTFKFDYFTNGFDTQGLTALIDGGSITITSPQASTSTTFEAGHFFATYTATSTKTVSLSLTGSHTVQSRGDFMLDNMSFAESVPVLSDGTLTAAGSLPFTSGQDGALTAITYTGGPADMLAGNDVLNIGTNAQTLLSTSGNVINGGAGVDTLKLAAGTALNLEGLTTNQTVKPIEQVEVMQMQGGSMLALSANDVLSLGGSNASTMSAYTFSSGGAVTTSSAGKVQFVVQGTASDALVLKDLKLDGVTTNGVVGNTGLSGVWESKGTVTLTGVDGLSHTYKVYDHSETQAQVLVDNAMSVVVDDHASITTTASLSSMTKDSSTGAANADWQTNDASAGRLVSGTLSATLGTDEELRVYANGNLLGPVQVEGTAWAVTDLNGYNSSWLYTVQVYNTSTHEGGTITTQTVTLDNSEAAPVITAVVDSASASIADYGTTATTLSTVSGTGVAGNKIYLYDNTGTNLVGTTTVAGDGTWSISGLAANAAVGSGSNAFAARQVDAAGNSSVLSNLWTVTSAGSSNAVVNGDFSAGNTGFTTVDVDYTTNVNHFTTANWYAITTNVPTGTAVLGTHRAEVTTSNTNLKWTTDYNVTSTYNPTYLSNPTLYAGNPNGKMSGNVLEINLGTGGTFWQENMSVVAGQTYTFEFDYQTNSWGRTPLTAIVDGTEISFTGGWFETGHFKATYTATETKTITLSMYANNIGNADSGATNGDAKIDNIAFTTNTVAADGSLSAGGTAPGTANADGTSPLVNYTAGVLDTLAGNDTITVPDVDLQAKLAAGGYINGGAGVDTLKLATGTTLDLTALTHNQTVKSIEQVEVFTMQGGSALTLSANDVLSLGGSNASTMSAYTFTGTTGGAASATSTGKVQMVINGTTTDALNLNPLALDGVTTNGVVGNTGLAGEWIYMGTTTNQINGVTYKVYNHSTTQAQVLTNMTASTESAVVSFSSMTKDSSLGTSTSDWFTADGSAGRLVSGTLETALTGTQTLKVYANGNELPASAISFSTDGLTWVVTDTNGYNANWVYRADVLNSSNVVIGSSTQVVTTDLAEAAPVITGVTDSTSSSVANNGTTSNTLSTVSGTGVAGDTIYLYDNSGTNLVGTTTVAADGTWSISGLATNAAVGAGSNAFSARMIDGLGNASVLSNLWTVTAAANVLTNGDFTNGLTGWTTFPTLYSTTNYENFFNNTETHAGYLSSSLYGASRDNRSIAPGAVTVNPQSKSSGANSGSGTISLINYEDNLNPGNPDGKFTGYVFGYNNNGATSGEVIVLSQDVNVVAGQTYKFSFDYTSWSGADLRLYMGSSYVNFVTYSTDDPASAYYDLGYVEGTFTASTTGTISLAFTSSNKVDFNLDNLKFAPSALAADGSLVGGGTVPFTSGVDGVSGVNGGAPISYTGGVVDMLAGDDVLNVSTNIQTLLSTAGNRIKGGDGIDTLKLATGTTLDLTAVTSTQTVRGIDQVEIFELQGSSTLTLSANDVLSLGQTNAFGTAATKVQFMINGVSGDAVVLKNLTPDGLGGNTGLAGMWSSAGTATVNSVVYNVYNHSTTSAQVLVKSSITSVTMETSPLVLDLNGNGIETTTLAAGAVFDLDANGTAERAAWVAGGDGLLVRDLDGNGLITSGAELFGSGTTLANGTKALDGFAALAGLDSNGDGIINASDAAFSELQVWVDANGDAHTDAGELKSLADLGIASLDLHAQASTQVNNGNAVGLLGSYTTTDGAEHVLADVWLQNQSLPVLDLTQVLSNGVVDMANTQAEVLRLNVSDVLQLPTNATGQHVLQITGDSNDAVDLSHLFADGHATGTWAQSGAVQQGGQTFNVYQYSGDASLQVLIDQHIAQGNVHLG